MIKTKLVCFSECSGILICGSISGIYTGVSHGTLREILGATLAGGASGIILATITLLVCMACQKSRYFNPEPSVHSVSESESLAPIQPTVHPVPALEAIAAFEALPAPILASASHSRRNSLTLEPPVLRGDMNDISSTSRGVSLV